MKNIKKKTNQPIESFLAFFHIYDLQDFKFWCFTTVWQKESRCPGLKDASKCYRPIIHPKSLTLGSVGYLDDYIFVPWSVEISREVWWLEPINDRFSQATPVSYASAAVHRAGASACCHIHKNPLTMHEHLFCNMPCTSLVRFFHENC